MALGHSQPHNQSVPGVKWLLREAEHLTKSKAEVENEWIYTSTSPHDFMISIGINIRSCWKKWLREGYVGKYDIAF